MEKEIEKSDLIFVFDLDSTITKREILPTIAAKIGCEDKMREITESTMRGEIPFKSSFLKRVELLSRISVSEVSSMVYQIPLNEKIAEFISSYRNRCYVVTGNLDVWIMPLMKKIGMDAHVYCSKAQIANDRIEKVISVVDKSLVAKQFVQPMVVIGDGDNDAGIARYASVGVGYGGVRNIAPSLLENIDYAFYDDGRCADFLKLLL